jgi:glycosyltransferase involved in cell wall biosynthesis
MTPPSLDTLEQPQAGEGPRSRSPLAGFGVVVIGRNEGDRLRRCLLSLVGRGLLVVYVDSGSTDGSVALARALGAEIVDLDLSIPFTAARARNAGVERLLQVDPNARFVQFVDGDCEIIDGWLERAVEELESRPDVAVVCGRLRERFPERSVYNRLADIEWDTPIGETKACGGIALMRVATFLAVGGFNLTVTAGEEPELCQRLRHEGWLIVRIDADMAWHDSAILKYRQWWLRTIRSGYGGLDVTMRFRRGRDGLFMKQIRSARLWAVGWPLLVIAGGGLGWHAGGPIVGLMIAGLLALTLPLQVLRLMRKIRSRVESPRVALAYGVLMMAAKWGHLLGQIFYLHDRVQGHHARLIEHKLAIGCRRLASSPVAR